MCNRQTCTIGHLNLIRPAITLLHVDALKVVRQMICSPSIHDLRWRGVGARRGRVARMLVVGTYEVGVVTVPTVRREVLPVATDLASRTFTTTIASVLAVSTAVSATVVRATIAATGGLAVTPEFWPYLPALYWPPP